MTKIQTNKQTEGQRDKQTNRQTNMNTNTEKQYRREGENIKIIATLPSGNKMQKKKRYLLNIPNFEELAFEVLFG